MEKLTFAKLLREARFLRNLGYNRLERSGLLWFLCYGAKNYFIE